MPDRLIASLNDGDLAGFVARLGTVYEHSPRIAAAAWAARPFADRKALAAAMHAVVTHAPVEAQLALIRAHPDLAGRLARAGSLGTHSTREQAGLGLDRLSDHDYELFDRLNAAYRARFGFPFVVAVEGMSRDAVLAQLRQRTCNTPDGERETALRQIGRIVWNRIRALE